MKKILISLSIIMLCLCGCSTNNKALSISEWMFDNTLTNKQVEDKIGEPSESSGDKAKYNDILFIDNISGTLSFEHFEKDGWPSTSNWMFVTEGDEKQYEKIHEYLNSNFKHWKIPHRGKSSIGEVCIFDTEYNTQFDENQIYTIHLYYSQDHKIIIEWGNAYGDKQKPMTE